LLFIQDLTNGVASQSANSFPNKFIDIKSGMTYSQTISHPRTNYIH
jgi:hypothetical protein